MLVFDLKCNTMQGKDEPKKLGAAMRNNLAGLGEGRAFGRNTFFLTEGVRGLKECGEYKEAISCCQTWNTGEREGIFPLAHA